MAKKKAAGDSGEQSTGTLYKFKKPHHEFAYNAGDVAELSDENAEKLLASGHVEVTDEKSEAEGSEE